MPEPDSPCDHGECIARNGDRNVAQVVLSCAADRDVLDAHTVVARREARIYRITRLLPGVQKSRTDGGAAAGGTGGGNRLCKSYLHFLRSTTEWNEAKLQFRWRVRWHLDLDEAGRTMMAMVMVACAVFASLAFGVLTAYGLAMGMFRIFRIQTLKAAKARQQSAPVTATVRSLSN